MQRVEEFRAAAAPRALGRCSGDKPDVQQSGESEHGARLAAAQACNQPLECEVLIGKLVERTYLERWLAPRARQSAGERIISRF